MADNPLIKRVTRRSALGLFVAAGGAVLAGCQQPATPAATQAPATKAATAAAQATAAATTKPAGTTAPAGTAAPAASPAAAGKTPKKGGTLRVGQPGDLANFDPSIQHPSEFPLLANIFDTPIFYDTKMVPQPYLAEKWQIAQDGLSLTMNLRKGVKFHTGREMTAEDINFSLARNQDTKTASLYKFMADKVTKAEAVDPSTVKWSFKAPYPGVYDLMSKLHIVDKENIDKTDFTKKGSGTGAFIFSEFVPGQHIVLKKNPNYWMTGYPYMDEVRISLIPDVTSMVTQLEAGALDVILRPALTDVVRLQKDAKYGSFQGAVRTLYDLLLLTTKGPFATNKKVRQAVNWIINREQYFKTVTLGLGDWQCTPWPAQSQAYFADLAKSIKPDLAKAKQLMAEGGVPNGFQTSILTSRQRQSEYSDIAVLYQQDLAKIGIQARIEEVDNAAYDQRHLNEGFETAVHAYARANYDPDTLIGGAKAWTPEIGMTRFGPPEYIKLYTEAGSSYDMAARKPLYRKLTEYIIDEAFCLPLMYNPEFFIFQKYVTGVGADVDYNTDFRSTWLDK
ncbi:MAG: ABC transporter substrate-binding protein [Chloroflexota bacterium]